jgi:integrase
MLVAILKNKYSVFLRWSYRSKRYSLSTGPVKETSTEFVLSLQRIIDSDLRSNQFNMASYKKLVAENRNVRIPVERKRLPNKSFLQQFRDYVDMIGSTGKRHDKMFVTLQMLESFGNIPVEQIAAKMQERKYSSTTFNERLACLRKVANYLVKTGKMKYNHFSEVPGMRRTYRTLVPERMPFSVHETVSILNALKDNVYNRNASQYHPFVKFLFMTGVRNAEAIGLTVEKVNFLQKTILINQSFARTNSGHHPKARQMQPTKTGNARYIPLTQELEELLQPLVMERPGDAFVFTSSEGNPIDDHQFQLRIWNPMLKELGMPHRNLYACRHTFGTRCSEQGMNPKDIQYLMGHADVRITLDIYVTLTTRVTRLPNMF